MFERAIYRFLLSLSPSRRKGSQLGFAWTARPFRREWSRATAWATGDPLLHFSAATFWGSDRRWVRFCLDFLLNCFQKLSGPACLAPGHRLIRRGLVSTRMCAWLVLHQRPIQPALSASAC